MHLNSINVDSKSITELEALHQANATRPTSSTTFGSQNGHTVLSSKRWSEPR